MERIKRISLWTVIAVFAIIFALGYIGQKTEVKDIDKASSLIASAIDEGNGISYNYRWDSTPNFEGVKLNLHAAIEILDQAETIDQEEQEKIDNMKKYAEAELYHVNYDYSNFITLYKKMKQAASLDQTIIDEFNIEIDKIIADTEKGRIMHDGIDPSKLPVELRTRYASYYKDHQDAKNRFNDLKTNVNKANGQSPLGLNFEFIRPKTGQTPPQELTRSLQSAMDDYTWRLNLVSEQTVRLDIYYATKAGMTMTPQEFKAWLDVLKSQSDEFMNRNDNAISSGRVYIKYLNAEYQNLDYDWYIREHNRIVKNEDIMKSDIQKAIIIYNQNVAKYNSEFVS